MCVCVCVCVCLKESEDFSDYQLQKLIKQSQLTGKIESLRKEMNQKVSGDISYALGDDYYGEVIEARRVVSEDAAHYILIKGLTRKQQIAEAERCKARRLLREEKWSEQNPDAENSSLDTEEQMVEEKVCDADEAEVKRDVKVSEENVSDSDEAEVKMGVKASSTRRRIHSDDEMSDDDKQQKSRRERRGKALVTRDGLRSVAKKGRSKPKMKTVTVSDDEEGDMKGKDKSTARRVMEVDAEDDIPVEDKKTRIHVRDKGIVVDDEEDDRLVEGKSKPTVKRDIASDNEEDDTPVSEAGWDERNPAAVLKVDTGEADLSEQSLESHSLSTGACDGANSLLKNTEQIPDTEDNTTKNETEETFDQPSTVQTEEESHFIETRQRLLTEEEDLMKAKEAKMAALMKSLERRTQVAGSPSGERKSSMEEEPSTQDTREKLLQQEEELMKEKELKMAALLKSVEKRSQLQSQSSQNSLKSEKELDSDRSRLDQESKEGKAEQTPCGFLEDVVDLERRTVLRKSKSRSANKAAPLKSSTSSKPLPFPALTVDYLEDVDTMLKISQNSSGICTAQNETDTNSVPVMEVPASLTMTSATSDKGEEGRTQVVKHAKVKGDGEDSVKSESVRGNVPSQDSLSRTGGFPSRTGKRVASERLDGKAAKKQAREASPPARIHQNNAEDSEGL